MIAPGFTFTVWDRRALVTSALLTAALLLLTVLVTAVTDEGGVALLERVSRTVPLSPVAAALATALGLARTHGRGEAKALEALGRSPLASNVAPAVGAFGVTALVSLFVLLDVRISLGSFFPMVRTGGPYAFDAGVFTNVATGVRVMADGSIALPVTSAALVRALPTVAAAAGAARVSAAAVTLLGSAAFVATILASSLRRSRGASRRGRCGWAVVVLLETAAASTFCLQAAAAGRAPLALVPLPSTLLLLGAVWVIVVRQSDRAEGWRRRSA